MTTKTLRRRFFSMAGRLTRSARRLTLHLPQRWPWEAHFNIAAVSRAAVSATSARQRTGHCGHHAPILQLLRRPRLRIRRQETGVSVTPPTRLAISTFTYVIDRFLSGQDIGTSGRAPGRQKTI